MPEYALMLSLAVPVLLAVWIGAHIRRSRALIEQEEAEFPAASSEAVTPFMRAQAEWKAAQQELEHIFNSIDTVVASWNAVEKRYIKISAVCSKMFGYPAERFYENGSLITTLIHPDDVYMAPLIMETAGRGETAYWEFRVVLSGGEVKWLESRIFPELEENGALRGITTVLTDITVRKQLALREAADLELAGRVQRSVLSAPLQAPGLAIDARYLPSQTLGGDMYAWYPLEDGRYGLIILDVMGQGVPSSLVGMYVRSLLKGLMNRVTDPGLVVDELNRHMLRLFRENGGEMAAFFFTGIYVLLDPAAGKLQYVNAGHCPALLIDETDTVRRLEPTTVPVGLLDTISLHVEELAFTGETRLLLFTDGLVEGIGSSIGPALDSVAVRLRQSFRRREGLSELLCALVRGSENAMEAKDDISVVGVDIGKVSAA
ncbi:PP2C family protein-serine/threonine phosphatase [Paenibacillus chartarius]|uniref:PP2C family protein-serine/threonine phosphatase n=1 Tax=Paenibacillus chartarius TaxID=747481 RepID=A0ABV6DG32_9BACL